MPGQSSVDTHSVALVALVAPVALHIKGLRVIAVDDATAALRLLLIDRRDELGVTRTRTANRIHRCC